MLAYESFVLPKAGEIHYWRDSSVNTLEDVQAFVNWARDQDLSFTDLKLLSSVNLQAIDILESSTRDQWSNPDPNYVAVIIPASNEQDIHELLDDIQRQAGQRTEEFHVYVAINGEGEVSDRSATYQSVLQADKSPHDNVIIIPQMLNGKGKMFAQHQILEQIMYSDRIPAKIIFLDGDVQLAEDISGNTIDILLDHITGTDRVSAVRVRRPENDETGHELASLMHDALIDVQNSSEGQGSLQGGGFAIDSTLAPLYFAFTDLLPGLLAVDINWAALVRAKGISVYVSPDTRILLKTDDRLLDMLTKQHSRWIRGMLEEMLLAGTGEGSGEQFIRILLRSKNIPKRIKLYVLAHLGASVILNDSVTLSWKNETATIGGDFPNPYKPLGWNTHR